MLSTFERFYSFQKDKSIIFYLQQERVLPEMPRPPSRQKPPPPILSPPKPQLPGSIQTTRKKVVNKKKNLPKMSVEVLEQQIDVYQPWLESSVRVNEIVPHLSDLLGIFNILITSTVSLYM